MDNAQVSATIQQVTSYDGARLTFMDAYSMLPGDVSTAASRIPGCETGNANACRSGDGDGLIGVPVTVPWNDAVPDIDSENTQFWKHLALTHMISGVTPSAADPDWGSSHPVAKIGGGFFIQNYNRPSNTVLPGHYLLLRKTITGKWDCGAASGSRNIETCTISPRRAVQMDRKMDDGIALTGSVLAISAAYSRGCGNANAGENDASGYAEGKDSASCDMAFRIM